MPSNSGTRVQIFGQVYHVKGGENEEQTREVARLVDQKMNLIADQIRTTDTSRVAVLAALHIADEYLSLKNEHERFKAHVAAKSDQMVSLLDEADETAEKTAQPSLGAD